MAKAWGCTVYGTAGSDTKIEQLQWLNIDHAVNYRQHDFVAEIQNQTQGQGVDVVLEMVGGEVYRQSITLLAPFGRVVVVGFASLDLQKWNPISWWKPWRAIPRANVGQMATNSYGVLASHLGYLLQDSTLVLETWKEPSLESTLDHSIYQPSRNLHETFTFKRAFLWYSYGVY